MIEIFSILSQLLIFLLIFSFPFTESNLNKFFNLKNNSLSLIDAHAINIIFFIYICLIFSFTAMSLEVLFKIYFLLALIFFGFNLKKRKKILNKLNFLEFLFFLIINFSIFFALAKNVKLEWDGLFWIEKSLIFFNGSGIENLKDTNPKGYPHLGSYLWAFFWKNSLIELEYFGRFFYIYIYTVSIFLISNILDISNKNIKFLVILFLILLTYDLYLFSGYQEYLIFSTLIIASRLIFIINLDNLKSLKLFSLIIFVLYLNCWFKNEGLIYFILFSFTFIIFKDIDNKKKALIIAIVPLLIFIQYFLEKNFIGYYNLTGANQIENIFNILANYKILFLNFSKIIYHLIISFLKYPLWILVLISIFYIILFYKKIDKKIKYFFYCLIFNIAFIFTIFITFSNIDFMLSLALDRLLFQTSGFFLILILFLINNIKLLKK